MRQLRLLKKQESILSDDQIQFVKSLKVPTTLHFKRADKYDDKRVNTSADKWVYYYSGNKESINFKRFPTPLSNLIKYALYIYCQDNSPTHLSSQFSSIYLFLKELKKDEFCYKDLSKKLEDIENPRTFYTCLFFLKILCKIELPGFKESDLDNLLLVPRPKDDNWLVYQNVDLVLDEPVKNMIVQGLWEVASKLDKSIRISTQELKYCSILGLCYTTGARPVQISKLSCSDLVRDTKGDNNKPARFSLKLPYAKQQKLRPERILISLPYELSKIILAYVRQSDLSGEDKLFELGAQSVQQIRYAINKQMLSFASEDFQEKVKNGDAIQPIYTSTDFRHNVGHSLAMQGASASEIAHILGHSSLVAAKHYILSTPELAQIRSKVLGTNSAYQQMIAMMLTGAITTSKSWNKKKVAGFIGDKLHSHVGGCSYKDDCPFSQVRSCYSCLYFHPFNDGNHNDVLKSVESELGELIELSDSVGNSKNPVINIQSNTHNEVRSVLNRCRLYNREKTNERTL